MTLNERRARTAHRHVSNGTHTYKQIQCTITSQYNTCRFDEEKITAQKSLLNNNRRRNNFFFLEIDSPREYHLAPFPSMIMTISSSRILCLYSFRNVDACCRTLDWLATRNVTADPDATAKNTHTHTHSLIHDGRRRRRRRWQRTQYTNRRWRKYFPVAAARALLNLPNMYSLSNALQRISALTSMFPVCNQNYGLSNSKQMAWQLSFSVGRIHLQKRIEKSNMWETLDIIIQFM